jgi:hypothetical protein
MTLIQRSGIKRLVYILIIVQIQACANYKFIPDSAVLNDNSIYFNDKLKVSIQLPGDFVLKKNNNARGINLINLNQNDIAVLKFLNIGHAKILFTGTPVVSPFYNLICIQQRANADTSMLKLTKKLRNGNTNIAIGSIPFDNHFITLVYYNTNDSECPYCDIDSIYVSNKRRIIDPIKSSLPYNEQSSCNTPTASQGYDFHIPKELQSKRDTMILEVNSIAPTDSSEVLYSYRLIKNPSSGKFTIKLCPGQYILTLKTYQNKTLVKTHVYLK